MALRTLRALRETDRSGIVKNQKPNTRNPKPKTQNQYIQN